MPVFQPNDPSGSIFGPGDFWGELARSNVGQSIVQGFLLAKQRQDKKKEFELQGRQVSNEEARTDIAKQGVQQEAEKIGISKEYLALQQRTLYGSDQDREEARRDKNLMTAMKVAEITGTKPEQFFNPANGDLNYTALSSTAFPTKLEQAAREFEPMFAGDKDAKGKAKQFAIAQILQGYDLNAANIDHVRNESKLLIAQTNALNEGLTKNGAKRAGAGGEDGIDKALAFEEIGNIRNMQKIFPYQGLEGLKFSSKNKKGYFGSGKTGVEPLAAETVRGLIDAKPSEKDQTAGSTDPVLVKQEVMAALRGSMQKTLGAKYDEKDLSQLSVTALDAKTGKYLDVPGDPLDYIATRVIQGREMKQQALDRTRAMFLNGRTTNTAVAAFGNDPEWQPLIKQMAAQGATSQKEPTDPNAGLTTGPTQTPEQQLESFFKTMNSSIDARIKDNNARLEKILGHSPLDIYDMEWKGGGPLPTASTENEK